MERASATYKAGFIGLGRMGQGMARNLGQGGVDLIVYDPAEIAVRALVECGALPASSVAEVAQEAEVVFTSLPGPAEVEEVTLGANGILANMSPGLTLVDLSTSSRELALCISDAVRSKGGAMLDAPVSGGPAGAASGDLVLWVGGDREVFDQYQELLRTFSKEPRHVGPIGAGTATKLAHNMLGYTILEALAESFSLAVKAGLDTLDYWEALRLGVVGRQSPLFMLVEQFLPNAYTNPAFALKLALKDVSLATAMAEELGVPMQLAKLTRDDMSAAVARGQGDEDSRSYMKLQLERARVSIQVDAGRLQPVVTSAQQKHALKGTLDTVRQ